MTVYYSFIYYLSLLMINLTPDKINGFYEFVGGLFLLNNVRVLLKHKEVKGVSILSVAFFCSWGLWNLYFYPKIGQWWSFYGGVFLVAMNLWWIYLMIYYTQRKKNERNVSPMLS